MLDLKKRKYKFTPFLPPYKKQALISVHCFGVCIMTLECSRTLEKTLAGDRQNVQFMNFKDERFGEIRWVKVNNKDYAVGIDIAKALV